MLNAFCNPTPRAEPSSIISPIVRFPNPEMGEFSSSMRVNGGDINRERHASPLFTIKYIYHRLYHSFSSHHSPFCLPPPPPRPSPDLRAAEHSGGLWIGLLSLKQGDIRLEGRCQIAVSHNKATRIHFPVKSALNKPDVSKHGSADCKACTNTPG